MPTFSVEKHANDEDTQNDQLGFINNQKHIFAGQ